MDPSIHSPFYRYAFGTKMLHYLPERIINLVIAPLSITADGYRYTFFNHPPNADINLRTPRPGRFHPGSLSLTIAASLL